MRIFVTADMHLGHDNIIEYCGRPFKDGNDQNTKLIKFWNERVKPEDVVYHVGDFCFWKGRQGTPTVKYTDWEKQLNGKIIYIWGNHDKNNGIKAIIEKAIVSFANKKILMQHYPPVIDQYTPLFFSRIPKDIDFVICGHVHEKWKYQLRSIPFINVGVDVWNFRPVLLDEVVGFYNKIKNENKGE